MFFERLPTGQNIFILRYSYALSERRSAPRPLRFYLATTRHESWHRICWIAAQIKPVTQITHFVLPKFSVLTTLFGNSVLVKAICVRCGKEPQLKRRYGFTGFYFIHASTRPKYSSRRTAFYLLIQDYLNQTYNLYATSQANCRTRNSWTCFEFQVSGCWYTSLLTIHKQRPPANSPKSESFAVPRRAVTLAFVTQSVLKKYIYVP